MSYECDRCGSCCRSLIIEVEELDILREPRLLQLEPFHPPPDADSYAGYEDEDEEDQVLGPLVPSHPWGAMLACGEKQPCPFLREDLLCDIYPTRPNVCLGFRAGSRQCKMARGMCGLKPLGREEVPIRAG